MDQKPLLAIVGPTASGKTALSVAMAKALSGEVVSCDSMQIYRRMDIGTAKPSVEERAGVPHYMLDVADPGEEYSVARYVEEAARAVEDIRSRGRLAVVAGGTGLYLEGLLAGRTFAARSEEERSVRDRLYEEAERLGLAAMHERLRRVDPKSADKLHINDKKRVLRALEVHALTGETISRHNEETAALPPKYPAVKIGLTTSDRTYLYRRIDERVDRMMAAGLEEEARALYEGGLLRGTAGQAIGYKELVCYFTGACAKEEAVETIKRRSRQYAKRQLSWFRRDPEIRWFLLDDLEQFSSLLKDSINFVKSRVVE